MLIPHSWLASLSLLATTTTLILLFRFISRPTWPSRAPKCLSGWPIIGSVGFFGDRLSFLQKGFSAASSGQFGFFYGSYSIVALSGQAGRQTFFTSRNLGFNEGYADLFKVGPDAVHLYVGKHSLAAVFPSWFKLLTHKDRIQSNIPSMAHNCKTHFEDIDTNSPLDVFESIDVLIYQITLRQLGCADIANDPDLLRSTLGMFLRSEGGSALEVMFPSLPTPSKRQRMRAGEELHMIYSNIMQNRRDTGRTEHDAMQAMMDAGESDVDISVFIMGATVAGLFNTTIMLVWTLMFLSRNSEWYQKVQDEVFAAVEKRRCSEAESGADILGRLAVEDWEGEFTMVNYCLRETIRLAMHGAAFRKNTGSKDIEIAGTGQVIPKNSYAVYPVADVHLNPEVYSHPHNWDPSRFLPSRAEDKKESHAYLGWGSGLHPCLGMRFAKVEVTMCVAMFFAHFNFKLVDKQGSVENARLPTLDHGRVSAARMPGQVFLKCERRM